MLRMSQVYANYVLVSIENLSVFEVRKYLQPDFYEKRLNF